MEPTYHHTQDAFNKGLIFGLSFLAIGVAFISPYSIWETLLLVSLPVLFLLVFNSLTVSVANKQVHLAFGTLKLIQKTIDLNTVTGVEPVKNKLIYGIGIRCIPNGRMYNIAGMEAVELSLKDGKVIRIGTDEPERLAEAIRQELDS